LSSKVNQPEERLVVSCHGQVNISGLLAHVKKPSRYIGNEFNVFRKDWKAAALRIALVFPDLYEIGMSHQGLQILYSIINTEEDLLADRVYVPDRDLEELLLVRGEPIFGVESRRSLTDFDMVGITLPYELCYTNILTIRSIAAFVSSSLSLTWSRYFLAAAMRRGVLADIFFITPPRQGSRFEVREVGI